MTALWEGLGAPEAVRKVLERASEAPGDSYLFVGPEGSGKLEAARIFAAAVLCEEDCGVCSTCTRTLKGVHPDVAIYEPEGYTYPLESIREMVRSSSQTPMEASKRIIIIEEADRIVERSQNALLKALEEPNASVTWILLASALDTFLPTILSRCRVVELAGLDDRSLGMIVKSRLDVNEEDLERIVRAARGDLQKAIALASDRRVEELREEAISAVTAYDSSPGWALLTADRIQSIAREARDESEARLAEEAAQYEEIPGRRRSGAGRRVAERHHRTLRRAEIDCYLAFLDWTATGLRDLAAASAGVPEDLLISAGRESDISKTAAKRSARVWMDLAEDALATRLAVAANANPGLAIESLLLRIAEPAQAPPRATIAERAGVAQR